MRCTVDGMENKVTQYKLSILITEAGVSVASCVRSRVRAQIGQMRDYNIGICCFSAKHAAFRRKSKDCFSRNQDNVSEWRHVYPRVIVSVSQHYKNPTNHVDQIQNGPHHHLIVLAMIWLKNCWVGIKQQSITHSLTL